MGIFRAVARGSIVAAAVFTLPFAGISTASQAAANPISAADPAYWTTPPDPLDLDVTLDAGHAATALVDSTGGTLTATGVDGTVFNLTIPVHSLPMATNVTMTPVTRISARGKSAGQDQVFAVQIEPSGTVLFVPARLEIVPKVDIKDAVRAPFAYDGAGDDAGLTLTDMRVSGLVFSLDHFSGYGAINWSLKAGGSNEYDVANLIADQIAFTLPERRMEAAIQREDLERRQKQLLGNDDMRSHQEMYNSYETTWHKEIFEPLLDIAANPGATCEQARTVLLLIMKREQRFQLYEQDRDATTFDSADDEAKFETARTNVVATCRKQALSACMVTGNPRYLLWLYHDESRFEQVVPRSPDSLAEIDAAYIPMIEQCAVYELKYTMTDHWVLGFMRYSVVLEGRVKVKPILDDFPYALRFEGVAEGATNPFLTSASCENVESVSSDGFKITCVCGPGASIEKPAHAKIRSLVMKTPSPFEEGAWIGDNLLELDFGAGAFSIPEVMTMTPGELLKSMVVGATAIKTDEPVPGSSLFAAAHGYSSPPEEISIPGWERAGYPTLFRVTYAGKFEPGEGFMAEDSTVFEFIHTPQPAKPGATPPSPPRKPLVKH